MTFFQKTMTQQNDHQNFALQAQATIILKHIPEELQDQGRLHFDSTTHCPLTDAVSCILPRTHNPAKAKTITLLPVSKPCFPIPTHQRAEPEGRREFACGSRLRQSAFFDPPSEGGSKVVQFKNEYAITDKSKKG